MTHEEERIAADGDARELVELVRKLTAGDLVWFLNAIHWTLEQRAVFDRINGRARRAPLSAA